MWEEKKNVINVAEQIAAEKRLNWVVRKLIAHNPHFDGLKFHEHTMISAGLEVYSPKLGILYKTEAVDNGTTIPDQRVIEFHPGPWADRALAEAQRIHDEHLKAKSVKFTPTDF